MQDCLSVWNIKIDFWLLMVSLSWCDWFFPEEWRLTPIQSGQSVFAWSSKGYIWKANRKEGILARAIAVFVIRNHVSVYSLPARLFWNVHKEAPGTLNFAAAVHTFTRPLSTRKQSCAFSLCVMWERWWTMYTMCHVVPCEVSRAMWL